MRVRCKKVANADVISAGWLTNGKEYTVLSILIDLNGRMEYRLIGDDNNVPALYSYTLFETISGKIPNSWILNTFNTDCVELTPQTWAVDGFWEKYFDREKEAIALFEQEKEKILRENS